MSLLNSKFDIVSVDNPVAVAALAQVLEVNTLPNPLFNDNGTPQPGTIAPGMIVKMDTTTGKAVLATTPDISAAHKVLPFVVIEGNTDYAGSFVQKLTVLHGGFTMKTDQYDAGAYTPGLPVTFNAGKVALLANRATEQLLGFVGPAGLDTVNNVLEVIVPQGAGI